MDVKKITVGFGIEDELPVQFPFGRAQTLA
jgi:hypothetical protein